MRARQVLSALTYGLIKDQVPVAYSTPRSGFGSGFGFGTGMNTGNLDAMGSVSTLYSIVNLTSNTTAQVDWHLYRKTTDGRRVYGPLDDNRREVTTHAALALWNNPNPFMTRQEFVERAVQHLDLAGECFWLVERVGNIPIELWPVRPDRMEEQTSKDTFLTGWIYREPDGTKVPLAVDEVIHLQYPNPTNVYRGMSPVASLMTDLESVKYAGEYNKNFFLNSAAPGGIVEVPNQLSDPEFREFQERWAESHRGVGNAHRVGMLDNGMKWVDANYTFKDMQFMELRNLSRDLIREAYRIHAHMLGQTEDVNLANATAASADFARWVLTPRLEKIELALNKTLLPMFGMTGQNVEFCYDSPIPEDRDADNVERNSKVDAAVKLIQQGFDPEETLAALGLPPIALTQVVPAAEVPSATSDPSQLQLEPVARLREVQS